MASSGFPDRLASALTFIMDHIWRKVAPNAIDTFLRRTTIRSRQISAHYNSYVGVINPSKTQMANQQVIDSETQSQQNTAVWNADHLKNNRLRHRQQVFPLFVCDAKQHGSQIDGRSMFFCVNTSPFCGKEKGKVRQHSSDVV